MGNTEQSFITSTKLRIKPSGFTIVELLVVIVIIGILAAITIVAYTGVTNRANTASIQSDLTNASQQLKMYYTEHGFYPTSISSTTGCPTPTDINYCIKISPNNTFSYTVLNGQTNPTTFHLTATNGNTSYSVTDTTSPTITTTTNGSSTGNACPTGFIPVPGSGTYGTSDFCVMKYAASHSDTVGTTQGTSTIPASQASAVPWVSISQTTAIANAPNTKNTDGSTCTTCHLITEAEYMTIAQNVLSVASNWSGGTVGSGYIYSGHNDNAPANALAADSSDSNGYSGETNTGGNQRRTLTLTNGEVIWDLAGNVYEWTTGTIAANAQPGLSGESAYAWKQWNNASLLMNGLPYNSQPASTGISGITGWSSTQGIGQLYSNYGETGTHAFLRGGNWNNGSYAGVLNLNLYYSSGGTYAYVGFRVSR
jgi:prepilin-type N-terminal cleavage/methylation domain-containing protein